MVNKLKVAIAGITTIAMFAMALPVANATVTVDGSTVTSDTTLNMSGAAGSILTLGAAAQTANIILGSSSSASSVLIGNGTGASTVGIATTGVAGNTVNIAGAAVSAATDTINIGTGNAVTSGGKAINIGTGVPGASTTNAIAIGNGGTTNRYCRYHYW